jgi:protein-disulfide isomerase-like protein with CxxC motif
VWLKTHIENRHIRAVLPVTIGPSDPNDISIEWDVLPSIAAVAAERINSSMSDMKEKVAELQHVQQQAYADALANISDPVLRAQSQEMAARFGIQVPTTAPAAPAVPAAPARDVASDLARLQQLHTSGVLSDDEFAAQRTKLLDQI